MSDSNGLRFWMLADGEHWLKDQPGVRWDRARRSLRLASERPAPRRVLPHIEAGWIALRDRAKALLEQVPAARDAFGTRARWDAATERVTASGAVPGEVGVFAMWRPGIAPTDLALGHDGVLYAAADGEVVMHDRRGRNADARLRRLGFAAWRLAADPAGGAWVIDRENRRLARTDGQLWPDLPFQQFDPGTFRPDPENPDPPRLRLFEEAAWPEVTTAAVACSPEGRVAVLTWDDADGQGLLRVLGEDGRLSDPILLAGAFYPYSLAWLGEDRVAVLVPTEKEAPAYAVPNRAALAKRTGERRTSVQLGDVYPLRSHAEGPFLHTVGLPPHYPTAEGSRPLHPLSLPSFAPRGETMSATLLDAGRSGAVWHRLYVEAAIPQRCAVVLRLAATETPSAPIEDAEWHEHRFGDAALWEADGVPRGAWVPHLSEVPFHAGLLQAEPKPGRAGLWTALVQRAGRRVRALRGRYLWVKAELRGDGLSSPELAAVRAYGSRFSYRDQYLPELYRETLFGEEADEGAERSTPADFLERFLANAEGVLTGIEDRIAHAHLLTDPRTVPAESLEWLGGWIGTAFDAALPEGRRRRMLAAAPELARLRGTARGLALALEEATGGAVSGGEIVIVEDFRLRRTFATILGADLADEDDPLLCGLSASGNSYVGDTLFLGDERRKEFLALFDADLPVTAREEQVIDAFFEKLAHRLTVLVHQEVEPQDLGLIRRVVEREAPAHVEWRVVAASRPLMVGVSSLVGVDTYLGRKPGKTPVRVNQSRIGIRDFVMGLPSLDPRLEGGAARVHALGAGATAPKLPLIPAPKPPEPTPEEPKPTEPTPPEPKPEEPKPAEPKPVEPKPVEPKPEEPKPVEPKPEEPKPTEPPAPEPPPPLKKNDPPIARLSADRLVIEQEGTLRLDAGGSEAAPGRKLKTFRWTRGSE
ncbi:MAG TPA: phage tail protein [Longimicrobium sp.]|nr:phage tail protein [Longimicrobium sp.]